MQPCPSISTWFICLFSALPRTLFIPHKPSTAEQVPSPSALFDAGSRPGCRPGWPQTLMILASKTKLSGVWQDKGYLWTGLMVPVQGSVFAPHRNAKVR